MIVASARLAGFTTLATLTAGMLYQTSYLSLPPGFIPASQQLQRLTLLPFLTYLAVELPPQQLALFIIIFSALRFTDKLFLDSVPAQLSYRQQVNFALAIFLENKKEPQNGSFL